MFNLEEVNELLFSLKDNPSESYESETVEFKGYRNKKAFFHKSREVVSELTAFANKSGGLLIVGVMDSANVKDMDWQSQLMGFDEVDCLEVSKRIRGHLNPMIPVDVMNHSFEERNYLLIQVKKYSNGLVMTVGGKCFMRSGRDSNPMNPKEVENKVKYSNGYDWTSDIVDIDVEDALDDIQIEEVMTEYKSLKKLGESAIPQTHFLEKIGITAGGLLTRGGLLFLGKSQYIKEHVGNIEYRFSKREGGGALPINEVWSGSVWAAITRMDTLLNQVIAYDQFIFDDKTYTFPNICRKSFEEAFINSLIHRDYNLEGLTTVEVSENSVTFVNPGEFYGGVTSSNIFTHPPRHRNPALASILINVELAERAGMGTRRMNIESLRLGRKKPRIYSINSCVTNCLELGEVKEGVFVVASPFEGYDVAELFLINILYGKGHEEISSVLQKISEVVADPWREVKLALGRISCLSLVGNKNGVFMVVNDSHKEALKAFRKLRIYSSSDAYVSIYNYLQDNIEATASELHEVLELESLAKTQRLLREAKFIEKIQNETGVTWQLVT